METNFSQMLDQINTSQTFLSALLSALMVLIGLFVKENFDRNASRRNYIRDQGYATHERLRDTLRGFLRSDYYNHLSIPKKVSREDISNLNISLSSYRLRFKYDKNDPFSNLQLITNYAYPYELFEKNLLSDITKVSKLSVPRVQKIATEIEDLYLQSEAENETLNDLFQDELGFTYDYVASDIDKAYMRYIQETHKKIFWIQVQDLLTKLEKEVERVVKLQL